MQVLGPGLFNGAGADAFAPQAHPGYVAGRWFALAQGVTTRAGVTGSADQIRFLPCYIPKPVTISDLGCYVTAGSSAKNVQLALYAMDLTTGRPTGSEIVKTASIDASFGSSPLQATVGTSVLVPAGWYFMAVNADSSAITFKTISEVSMYAGYVMGSGTINDVMGGATTNGWSLSLNRTFGTWGSVTGASFVGVNQHTAGLVYIKAA